MRSPPMLSINNGVVLRLLGRPYGLDGFIPAGARLSLARSMSKKILPSDPSEIETAKILAESIKRGLNRVWHRHSGIAIIAITTESTPRLSAPRETVVSCSPPARNRSQIFRGTWHANNRGVALPRGSASSGSHRPHTQAGQERRKYGCAGRQGMSVRGGDAASKRFLADTE